MLWDAIPADIDTHHGLLQQLAHCGDYIGETRKLISTEPVVDDLLTCVNGPISVLELSVDSILDVFVERHLENKAAVLTKQVEFINAVLCYIQSFFFLFPISPTLSVQKKCNFNLGFG